MDIKGKIKNVKIKLLYFMFFFMIFKEFWVMWSNYFVFVVISVRIKGF